MARLPCICLSWPLTKPPFGSCAISFPHSVRNQKHGVLSPLLSCIPSPQGSHKSEETSPPSPVWELVPAADFRKRFSWHSHRTWPFHHQAIHWKYRGYSNPAVLGYLTNRSIWHQPLSILKPRTCLVPPQTCWGSVAGDPGRLPALSM